MTLFGDAGASLSPMLDQIGRDFLSQVSKPPRVGTAQPPWGPVPELHWPPHEKVFPNASPGPEQTRGWQQSRAWAACTVLCCSPAGAGVELCNSTFAQKLAVWLNEPCLPVNLALGMSASSTLLFNIHLILVFYILFPMQGSYILPGH